MVAARPLQQEEASYSFNGAAAAQPAPRYQPWRRERDATQPGSRRRSRTRVKQGRRAHSLPSVQFFLTLLFACALIFGLGVRYASISSTGQQLLALRAQHAQLVEEKALLQGEIGRLAAPGRVEEGAMKTLGMTRPLDIQSVAVAGLEPVTKAVPQGRSAVVTLPPAPAAAASDQPAQLPQAHDLEAPGEYAQPAEADVFQRAARLLSQWLTATSAQAGKSR